MRPSYLVYYSAMATVIASGDLHLDSYDCETCGTNYNDLEWSWDGSWITIHASVGCYSSYDKLMDTEADVEAFVVDFSRRYPDRADDLQILAAELNAVLNADSMATLDRLAGEFDGKAICRECGEDLDFAEIAADLEYHESCV